MLLESLLIVLCVLVLGLAAGLLWTARELRRLRSDVLAQGQGGGGVPSLLIHGSLSRIEQRLARLEQAPSTLVSARPAAGSAGVDWPAPVVAAPPPRAVPAPAPAAAAAAATQPTPAEWPPMPPVAALPIRDLKPAPAPSMLLADAAEDGQDSYALARRLARQGADLQQLVQICALSRDEAELVLRLHGPLVGSAG